MFRAAHQLLTAWLGDPAAGAGVISIPFPVSIGRQTKLCTTVQAREDDSEVLDAAFDSLSRGAGGQFLFLAVANDNVTRRRKQ